MKKSFLLHHDSLDVLDAMTDEQCGKLLKKMRSYHNGNKYDSGDSLVKAVFIQFKNQFDRDIENWHRVKDARSKAGAKGGRPKKQIKQLVSEESKGKQSKAKKAVKVNVKVKGNVNVKVNKESNNTLSNDKGGKPSFGDPEINECIEIIKKANGGILDGTIRQQRRDSKSLINKIKKLKIVQEGQRTRSQYLSGLVTIIANDPYQASKLGSVKKIYDNLASLQQVAKTMNKKQEPKKNFTVSRISL